MKISNIKYNFIICQAYKSKVLGSSEYNSVYILKSVCNVITGNKLYRASPDSVIFVSQGTECSVEALNTPVYVDCFSWNENTTDFPMNKLFSNGVSCNELSNIIKIMKTEDLQDRQNKDAIIACYAELFLLMAMRTVSENKNRNEIHPFFKLREDIYNQPYKNWDISKIISESGMCKRQFYYSYKALFSTSIKQDIIASRMEYAKYLLLSTDMRITQIAESCCYSCDQHFVQSFSKYFGVSPTRYRFNFLRFHAE